jgi:Fe-S cluster biogenesis protein NfuA
MTINLTSSDTNGGTPFTNDDERVQFEALDKLINSLRPIFVEEGGDARAVRVRDGIAYVAWAAGCEGCGSPLESMEGGLGLMIQERIPGVRGVVFE